MESRFKSEYKWGRHGELVIDHADIFWTNFRGEEKVAKSTGKIVNMKGQRNFNVYIYDNDLAEELIDTGWNVRILPPRNEGDEVMYALSVELKWKDRNGDYLNEGLLPLVHLEGTNGETDLTEDTVGILDRTDLSDTGVVIRPHHYDGADGHKIKAYLAEGWFVVEENNRGDMYRRQKENDTENGKLIWDVPIEDRVVDILDDLETRLDLMDYTGNTPNSEYDDMCKAVMLLENIYRIRKA